MNMIPENVEKQVSKAFFPLPHWTLSPVLTEHGSTALYRSSTQPSNNAASQPDRRYNSNNGIWEEINYMKFRRTDVNIVLDSFFIYDWFPRSPGLFYTPDGRRARQKAMESIIGFEEGVLVFDPYGKASMLEGGIGNIRMKPILINNQYFYFISASSNGWADEGFPVALPEGLYNNIIEELENRGAINRNLIGRLRFIPENLVTLYSDYRAVPKLYIEVQEISPASHPKSRAMEELRVRIAVTFRSDYEGHTGVYATYSAFDPSNKDSFRDSLDWMEEQYVWKKYKGHIITDFDETITHFKNAPFSLSKVMGCQLKLDELNKLNVDFDFSKIISAQNNVIMIQELNIQTMENNKYKVTGGQIVNVGDNGQVSNFTQQQIVQDNSDLNALVDELSKLRIAAKAEAKDADHDAEVGIIASAESAAKKGDKSKALKILSSAGKWTIDVATKIGVNLVSAYIKSQTGL